MKQLSIWDWMPEACPDPEPGEIVNEHGSVIPHIMRPGYIGHKVCFDVSTESRRNLFMVGILEEVLPSRYYRLETDGEYRPVECDRSVIFTGSRQRSLITHMPGREIFELR